MPSAPPKPWERNGAVPTGTPASATPAAPGTVMQQQPAAATTAGALTTPDLPARPTGMTTGAGGAAAAAASPYPSTYAASRFGTGGYGTYGGLGSYGSYGGYGSPYSRLGSSYGGYGGFGGGYGGYGGFGGGMYGQPGFGVPGMPGQPGPDGLSLSQRMESGTAATFQIIESIVGAFGGFAQMLESTFMATHSSFFAMIGVAEQFGNLRNYLGQVLSIFTLINWARGLIARITGREPPPGARDPFGPGPAAAGFNADSFRAFENGQPVAGPSANPAPRPSRKPLIVFFLTVIGIPYLMNRLVRLINARQLEDARLRGEAGPNGTAIDPAHLTFVRATHAYTAADPNLELSFQPNDIIAILTPPEERQHPGWWRGRLRDGRVGWLPSTHVSELPAGKSQASAVKTIDDPSPPPGTEGKPTASS